MKLFLLLVLIITAVHGEQITAIAGGTGFSACTGYCYNSIYINATKITTSRSSRTNPLDYPAIQQGYSIEALEFEELVQLVGNIQLWKSVDSPIGCPDCNQQGLEWIDVYTDTQPKYGITFEYNSNVTDYQPFVNRLRTIRLRYFPNK